MRTFLIFISVLASYASGCTLYAQTISQFSNGIISETTSGLNSPQNPKPEHLSFLGSDLNSRSFLDLPREKPGVAFLSSAIIPGSGQAVNGKWIRAGIYFTVEVIGLIYHLDRNAKARRQERAYEQFIHQNWSVMAYAEWLVNYSQVHGLNNNWQSLDAEISGNSPDWSDTRNDWNRVPLNVLHTVEASTPFYFKDRVGSNFSHLLPKYGSQQYYELVSKYYQFQPGWRDWYTAVTTGPVQNEDIYRYFWNGTDEPFALFYEGRDRAETFNDNYRIAGNILKLMVLNHVVSAFDALFTVQLKNSRIETHTNLMKLEQFSVTWYF